MNTQHTLISVTLDNLRGFDLNPRIIRNPHYDDIKASIRQRGLYHPPHITRRPGESHYIIATGGNTRLAILNELWQETQDKKFWHITCQLHEWPSSSLDAGNLYCLLGHLAENELRGSLTFIERALALQKVTSLYHAIHGALSQKALVQRLRDDGYPAFPSHYSVMMATIQLLLPHIPELLYSGLSRNVIEKILTLRSGTEAFWDAHCQTFPSDQNVHTPLFDDVFSLALMPFNGALNGFSLPHLQDELTGLVSQSLGIDYNTVALVTDAQAQKRKALIGSEPVPELPVFGEQRAVSRPDTKENREPEDSDSHDSPADNITPVITPFGNATDNKKNALVIKDAPCETSVEAPRQPPSDKRDTALSEDMPFPPTLAQTKTSEALVSLIEQAARELAESAALSTLLRPSTTGLFEVAESDTLTGEQRIYWQILAFFSGQLTDNMMPWRHRLLGSASASPIFSDEITLQILKLVRLIRLFYQTEYRGEL